MDGELRKRAKVIIDKILYATLATVSEDGLPWNTPVFSASDDKHCVYWGSHKDSQHSKNIRATGKGFIVIYDSTVEAGEGSGVYMQVNCVEITDTKEIAYAHELLQNRRPVPYWKLEEVQASAPIRLYKAIPEKVWMNGDGELDGHYIDIREEVSL